jgi:hypothetical protein
MTLDGIRLQNLKFVDRRNGVPQGLLDVFDLRVAFMRVLRMFHQMQCGFKNIGDVENWGVRHSVLHSGGQQQQREWDWSAQPDLDECNYNPAMTASYGHHLWIPFITPKSPLTLGMGVLVDNFDR